MGYRILYCLQFVKFVKNAISDHMVEEDYSIGLDSVLCVTSDVSLCFPT